MSTSTTEAVSRTDDVDDTPIGVLRLARVELRKAFNTRTGFWLAVTVALASLATVAVQVFAGDEQAGNYATWLTFQQTPVGFVVPVIAILVVTGEWSTRTSISTFTLIPARQRVLGAKFLAVLVIVVGSFVLSAVATTLGTVIGSAVQDTPADWSPEWWQVLQTFVLLLFSVLVGFALGVLLLNSPAAIVLYFVVPLAFSALFRFVDPLADIGSWVDFTTALAPVAAGVKMGSQEWAQIAVASAIWVFLPSILGAARVQRAEIN